jgi:hypothetical protein
MTVDELLRVAWLTGIRLEARGDRLHVVAPTGRVTPDLRSALEEHKSALLARLRRDDWWTRYQNAKADPGPALGGVG